MCEKVNVVIVDNFLTLLYSSAASGIFKRGGRGIPGLVSNRIQGGNEPFSFEASPHNNKPAVRAALNRPAAYAARSGSHPFLTSENHIRDNPRQYTKGGNRKRY